MLQFYQKRSWRSIVHTPIVIGLLGVICVLLGYAVYDRYVIARDMKERREVEDKVLDELLQKKDSLKNKVEYLSNERGIEAEMRRNFDIALPGEQVVIIMDEKADGAPAPMPPMPVATSTPRWYAFWE